MVAWVVIDRQHLRQTSPSFFPCSHSHFGTHPALIPEEIIPFFPCTYVEPILQPLCFHIHACNGGGTPLPNLPPSNLPTFQRVSELSPFFSNSCALFCAFLHSRKTQLFYFQSIPHSLPQTTRGGGREMSLLTRFNSLINALDSFNHALAIPIESRHEESAPPLQHSPAARARGRIYCHGAGPARMCYLRTKFGASEENGEGRHIGLYRKPQEARGAHPDRRRNVGYLSGSRVCRD